MWDVWSVIAMWDVQRCGRERYLERVESELNVVCGVSVSPMWDVHVNT